MENYIYFIGTGCGRPVRNRQLPGYLIKLPDGQLVLLECGCTINSDGSSLPENITRIDLIAISAPNVELIAGLPSLLHSMRLLNRTRPLTILAPQRVLHLLGEILSYDELETTFTLQLLPVEQQNIIPLGPNSQILIRKISTTVIDKFQFGLQYKWNNQEVIIYYTGKTRGEPIENLSAKYLFVIHDCTYSYNDAYLSEKTGLASYKDALRFLEEAKPLAMMLVHYSTRYENPQKEISTQRALSDRMIFAYDSLIYDVGHILGIIQSEGYKKYEEHVI